MITISPTEVMKRLGVDESTLVRWHKSGALLRSPRSGYATVDLNHFLAACARGFERPPVWRELQAGQLVLVSADEAVNLFEFEDVRTFIIFSERYRIPQLRFPGRDGRTRYHRAAITTALTPFAASVSGRFVMCATGHRNMRFFRDHPELEVNQDPRSSAEQPLLVTERSFIGYLRAHLPQWVEPQDWIADYKVSDGRLVPLVAIAEETGMSVSDVLGVFQDYKLPYIFRRHVNAPEDAFASPLWRLPQQEKGAVCRISDITRLFCVTHWTVSRWGQKEVSASCPLGHWHTSRDRYWRKICWLAYLNERCNAAAKPYAMALWAERLVGQEARPLLNASQVAKQKGSSIAAMTRALESGRLPGLKTPGGSWRISPEWLG